MGGGEMHGWSCLLRWIEALTVLLKALGANIKAKAVRAEEGRAMRRGTTVWACVTTSITTAFVASALEDGRISTDAMDD